MWRASDWSPRSRRGPRRAPEPWRRRWWQARGNGGAAVVLGSANGGKALIVAASTKRLVARGVTAPELLEVAAKQIGGGAGGKPTMAFAGGPNGGAVPEAVAGIPARLAELLAGA